MAQNYDVSLKLLFRRSSGIIAQQVFGPGGVTEWVSVEQPKVNNPRGDMLARCGDGVLRQVEFEIRNHPDTPRRQAEYYLGFHRLLDEHVEQVVLFASKERLTMRPVFRTKSMRHRFRILDLKRLDGEPLIASEDWGDNILALLTKCEKERVLRRVEDQLRRLKGEEQQSAANILVILSGIIGIGEQVLERIAMLDLDEIMETEVLVPARRLFLRQGIAQGERTSLARLLTKKFGPLPQDTITRLKSAQEPELLAWFDRAIDAVSLDEVFV